MVYLPTASVLLLLLGKANTQSTSQGSLTLASECNALQTFLSGLGLVERWASTATLNSTAPAANATSASTSCCTFVGAKGASAWTYGMTRVEGGWAEIGCDVMATASGNSVPFVTSITVNAEGCKLPKAVFPDTAGFAHLRVLKLANCPMPDVSVPWTDFATFNPSLQELWLKNAGMKGSINSDIGLLGQLKLLEVSGNKLSGAIPTEIGNLKQLNYLLLDNNTLTGQVPNSINGLPSLISLRLVDNNFTIPALIPSLSSITTLATCILPSSSCHLFSSDSNPACPNLTLCPSSPELEDRSSRRIFTIVAICIALIAVVLILLRYVYLRSTTRLARSMENNSGGEDSDYENSRGGVDLDVSYAEAKKKDDRKYRFVSWKDRVADVVGAAVGNKSGGLGRGTLGRRTTQLGGAVEGGMASGLDGAQGRGWMELVDVNVEDLQHSADYKSQHVAGR
ncbi:hypothetical protein BJ742DRAFT_775442 [Cladochytrium replicatum]|nr:hypothetical protein BJ742DRAFT_775442 [Cladochytrium replicatum]